MLGAPRNDQAGNDAGKTYLFFGKPTIDWGLNYPAALADVTFLGVNEAELSGRRVSSAGDVNLDGYADLLIGAPHASLSGNNTGAVYLLFGRPTTDWGSGFSLSEADITYIGKSTLGSAGYDETGVGDVNGDGIPDFLVGAFGGYLSSVPGEAYLLWGHIAPIPTQFSPDTPQGRPREWHDFTTGYQDWNGWQDIASVQLSLSRSLSDPKSLVVRYDPADDALYLQDINTFDWIGPCSPGQKVRLTNTIAQLDCERTVVTINGKMELQVIWHARWLMRITTERLLTGYLKGIDQSSNDSGYQPMGTWTLIP